MAESSWELASNLPPTLIYEFENGIHRNVHEQSYTSGGQTIYTLSSSRQDSCTAQPDPKKIRLDRDSSNSG